MSDKNLKNDKFFSNELLLNNNRIDINKILNCNKMKTMTGTPKDIMKSIKNSKMVK
jgi:hypothetical protein